MELRQPAVAGAFYEKDFERLERQLKGCYVHKKGPGALPISKREKRVSAIITPHAGYQYSGPCAAWAYKELAESVFPDAYLIIGTNHSGYPSTTTALNDWQTPLGVVRVDQELARSLIQSGIAQEDLGPHLHEHSIEVQLPFLQDLFGAVRFAPVCMGLQELKSAVEVGEVVRDAIRGTDAVVLASTDFSHYIPKAEAARRDRLAIDRILGSDVKGFYRTVKEEDVSMCGYGPVIAMMTAVAPAKPEFLKYASSGDVAPMEDVVGYAAIAIRR